VKYNRWTSHSQEVLASWSQACGARVPCRKVLSAIRECTRASVGSHDARYVEMGRFCCSGVRALFLPAVSEQCQCSHVARALICNEWYVAVLFEAEGHVHTTLTSRFSTNCSRYSTLCRGNDWSWSPVVCSRSARTVLRAHHNAMRLNLNFVDQMVGTS